MSLEQFIRAMPKVELHVHLEGSVQPKTLLQLAERNGIELPAQDLDGLRDWYQFRDFPHFVDVYLKVSECIRTVDDIELITREFLAGQAAQNIVYSEVTYTALTHYVQKGLEFEDQLSAIHRARAWARAEHNVDMNLIIDIPRSNLDAVEEESMTVAEWAADALGDGVVALGLAGNEVGYPPEWFADAFDYAREMGLASIVHAGETVGPESIWGAIHTLGTARIGHGVRCLEDPRLVDTLRDYQIPLEVCPTSNVCLGVVPSFEAHMLPDLIEAGLYVTINSDDPPMFNTTLTDEYLKAAATFGFDAAVIETLVLNAVRATLLSKMERSRMEAEFKTIFRRLHELI